MSLEDLSEAEQAELIAGSRELAKRENYKNRRYFPDCTPACANPRSFNKADHAGNCRVLYFKHLTFFDAGLTYLERLFLAANRIGKTDAAAFEVTCHLTGVYPWWWAGRRFKEAGEWWAAGTTAVTTRDVIQRALFGPPKDRGTGMIPQHLIVDTVPKPGTPDAVGTIWVRHVTGKLSAVSFKSYDQGRTAYEGTEKQGVWLDEEPPPEVEEECLLRTMTVDGMLIVTFTPLEGLTPFVQNFLETCDMNTPNGTIVAAKDEFWRQANNDDPDNEREATEALTPIASDTLRPSRFMVGATWDHAPHLTERAKTTLLAGIHPQFRAARSRGVPQLGAGMIYPVQEADIKVKPFVIPKHWPRFFAMDAGGGAKPTAAVWFAYDPEAFVLYIYSVYRRSAAEPAIHASAIKGRGAWIPGVGDCAALIMTVHDVEQLIQTYINLGLDLELPDKSVETGLFEVWELLSTGRLRVFDSCEEWFEEQRFYRRDKNGKIIKKNDHVMDATRYGVRSGRARMKVEPIIDEDGGYSSHGSGHWLGT